MEISGHGSIFAFKRVTSSSQQSHPSLSNETRQHVRHPAGSSQPSHRCGGRQYRSPSNCSSVLFSMTKSSLPTDLMLLGIVTCLLGVWLAQMSFSRMLVNICCHKVPPMSCGWFPASGPARSLQRTSLKGDASPGHLLTASTSSYHSSYPSARLF